MKQQLRSHIRQRHVAELVNRDQFVTTIPFYNAAELVVMLRFDEFVNESGSRCKSHSTFLLSCGSAKGGRQMGFAGARLPEKNDRLGLFYVASLRQIPDLRSRDFGRLRKVEIL